MVSPTSVSDAFAPKATVGAPAVLTTATAGAGGRMVVASAVVPTGLFPGSRAASVAVFSICPASTSSWVNEYVAVHEVSVAPTARDGRVHDSVGKSGSVTTTLVSVTLPVFLIVNP